MTERGNIDTDGLRRFEDRERLLKLVGLTIYYRRNQYLLFQKSSASKASVKSVAIINFRNSFAHPRSEDC